MDINIITILLFPCYFSAMQMCLWCEHIYAMLAKSEVWMKVIILLLTKNLLTMKELHVKWGKIHKRTSLEGKITWTRTTVSWRLGEQETRTACQPIWYRKLRDAMLSPPSQLRRRRRSRRRRSDPSFMLCEKRSLQVQTNGKMDEYSRGKEVGYWCIIVT